MLARYIAESSTPPTFTVDEVLSPYVYVFYAAFIVAFIFTPVMRSVAMYYRIIDQPDQMRKMHSKPVAYLGGVAVFLGWISGLAMSQFLFLQRNTPGLDRLVVSFSIVAGACIIVLLGLWDDVKKLRPWLKILGQVAAALLLSCPTSGTHTTRAFLRPITDRAESIWLAHGSGVPRVAGLFDKQRAGDRDRRRSAATRRT